MWETKSKVTLKCVVGGERKPEFVLHSIQWVDQTNGRTINTFRDGRTVTDQVREHTHRHRTYPQSDLDGWAKRDLWVKRPYARHNNWLTIKMIKTKSPSFYPWSHLKDANWPFFLFFKDKYISCNHAVHSPAPQCGQDELFISKPILSFCVDEIRQNF